MRLLSLVVLGFWGVARAPLQSYRATDGTTLKVMRQLVNDLHSHGIWTIVDFHQAEVKPSKLPESVRRESQFTVSPHEM